MPSLNLSNKSLRYSAADETALDKAVALCTCIGEYDDTPLAKQDATTASVALKALAKHVAAKRKPVQP